MEEHSKAPVPIAVYGTVLLLCVVSWGIMQAAIVRTQSSGFQLRAAIRGDVKGSA